MTELKNENVWVNFRNRAILSNNIERNPIKRMDPKDKAAEVCGGIVELDESQQAE